MVENDEFWMLISSRWTRPEEGSHRRQQVEKTAGKQSHLLEHLTLITPVGILTQPFVTKCVLTVITMQGEGKGKELRITNKKWITGRVTASKLGRPRGFSASSPSIKHMSKNKSQGHHYSECSLWCQCRTEQDGFQTECSKR